MIDPEIVLWRSVLRQAISDAAGRAWDFSKQKKGTRESLMRQAQEFLFGNPSNLKTVCALADIEPEDIRAIARKELEDFSKKDSIKKTSQRFPEKLMVSCQKETMA